MGSLEQNALLQLLVGGGVTGTLQSHVAPAAQPALPVAPLGGVPSVTAPPRVVPPTVAPSINSLQLGIPSWPANMATASGPPGATGLSVDGATLMPSMPPRAANGQHSSNNAKMDQKGRIKSKAQEKLAAGEPVFCGIISHYNAEKKNGKVVCDAMYEMTNDDVYCFEKVLLQAKAGPGDTIAFFIHWSAKGQAQVSFPIMRIGCADDMFALKGTVRLVPNGTSAGRIECVEIRHFWGKDIEIGMDTVSKLQLVDGVVVAFNATMSREGVPQVTNVEVCDIEWEPIPADLGVSGEARGIVTAWQRKNMDKWRDAKNGIWENTNNVNNRWGSRDSWNMGDVWGKGLGKGKEFQQKRKNPMEESKCEPTGESFTGILKVFNEGFNYGFIDCPEVKAKYSSDVLLLRPNTSVTVPGTMVIFDLALTSKMQPQALNCRSLLESVDVQADKRQKLDTVPTASAPIADPSAAAPVAVVTEALGPTGP